ncbi:MAG: FAD-dependent oxidoreductase [Candidatus Anammoximicrobium sp.]|nr:FAD-dependent oxidoreductase [Candidatus Anammoximicrobium sp.]
MQPLILLTWLAAGAVGERCVWIEAERFADPGGWTNDAQFIDQMGSPYLLAIGLGAPVDDAVTTVPVPQAGKYRLWVRTKDWAPKHHPGSFQVVLGGRTVERVFGASGRRGWSWEDGGIHELSGAVEVRLHDLTGYYARCDALALAADLQWTPPQEPGELAAWRERHGGVSREVKDAGTFDAVVVGGGLAGCTAAVAAARRGARTALIQNRPVLGGNASTEILVPPVGVWPSAKRDPLDPRETGLVEEYRTAGNQTSAEAAVYSARLLRFVQAEPNLTLCLNTHATGVQMRSGQPPAVGAVLALDVRTGQRLRFAGQVFLDCTGDAVVGAAAGAEYRHGKEPRSMYNEPWAPEQPSTNTMGNTLKYASVDAGSPQSFAAPPWAMKFPTCESFSPGRHPRLGARTSEQWVIELGGLGDTYADAEEIRDDLLRLVFGLWDHLKNHCPRDEKTAANHRLAWVGHVAGKRESRRLIGDYVLTENDIRQQTLFPDRVAYGGWTLDDHHSAGFFHPGSFGLNYDCPGGLDPCMGWQYSIPYRCLYSKNVDNLLMAGRNISASHLALSNTRVMLTCAVIGQAAGTAAALCARHQTTPRGVYQDHLEQLQQQLLKDGAYLIDLPNRDPRDVARCAAVTASSEAARAGSQTLAAGNVVNGYARPTASGANVWSPQPGSETHWLQLEWPQPQTFNVVHTAFANKRVAPRAFRLDVWQNDAWRTVAQVSAGRRRHYVLGLDAVTADRLRWVFTGPVTVGEVRVYDEPPPLVETARRVDATLALPDVSPALAWFYNVDPRKLPGLVIDASQAEQVGQWVSSTFAEPYVLDGYVHDGNDGKGEKSIRFVPDVPHAGKYEIRLSYVPYGNRASNTPVTVTTPAGSQTVRINQRQVPAIDRLFHGLGAFDLPAGRQTSVAVETAGTDGYVVVDALQLIER